MVSPFIIFAALCLYMTVLFLLALWAARRSAGGRSIVNNPLIYSLGLTVLYTSWTFYGSVGRAANIGMMFLALYIGTMMPLFFWWTIVRKMVRIKNNYKITSIADFISARYDKSAALAGLVTVFSLVGVMPYIALQLKAIISTYEILRIPQAGGVVGLIDQNAGIIITLLMIGFTIAFGVRRLDPTERHPGMVMAIAAEGIFKLLAFLLVGLFVTYYLFDGLGDIFSHMRELQFFSELDIKRNDPSTFSSWISYLIISMFAVMFLPRQFHMMVVENSNENHIKTAMWFLPLYMVLITFLCFPVAIGGLLTGLSANGADTFVLRLPIDYGSHWLSIVVFIGGVAASSGMVMICAMTMSTMLINHILLPLMEWIKPLKFLKRHLLQCRWAGVACAILVGYFFERTVGSSHMLVSMGVISFAAASQFAPPILGGIFWRNGNKVGALIGLSLGFIVWAYTMILPAFAKSGWISGEIVHNGPLSIALLKPEQLFGLTAINPLTNTVFWSLVFNVLGYVVGSILFRQSEPEERLAEDFVSILEFKPALHISSQQAPTVDLLEKRKSFEHLLGQYFSPSRAQAKLDDCFRNVGVETKTHISIVEFAELHSQLERSLAGAIGAAAAQNAIKRSNVFSAQETDQLSKEYANILASLKITPEELRRRIDYYQEREKLLTNHAEDLKEQIKEREREIRYRREVEEKLKKAEEKYRGIFENAVEGIYQTTPEGRFVSVNVAMSRMLGYDSPEDLIANVTDIKTQLYATPQDRESLLQSMEKNKPVTGFEAQFLRKDNSRMWARIHARPIHDDNGKLILFEGIFQDITARKKAEEERARLEEQLRQSQKMEAIGQLAGGVAHDFNNLLTAIIGYSDVLMHQIPKDSLQSEKLGQINRAAERAAELTKQLLAFSRKQLLNVRIVNLNEIIGDLEEMLRRLIGEDIRLITSYAEPLGKVQADTGQIQQIVMNLVVNARDAMHNGGTLTVKTANVTFDEEYSRIHSDVEPGDYVMFSVEDTGQGMDPETQSRVFDPFFTTKEMGVGTGLGLSTVYGIVKQHKGHIVVRSELNHGTRFNVYFQKAQDDETMKMPEQVVRSSLQTEGDETILVVEDEEIVRKLICEVLEALRYSTIQAGSPEEALTAAKQHEGTIDLLLTDVVLPQMDGRSLFEKISIVRPNIKVLFISGYAENSIVRHGVLDPEVPFLQKPFSADSLAIKVREVLDTLHKRL